jgi:hypothetical protein
LDAFQRELKIIVILCRRATLSNKTIAARWQRRAFFLVTLAALCAAAEGGWTQQAPGNVETRQEKAFTERASEGTRDSEHVVLAAGDIADCRNLAGAQGTAKLLGKIPSTILALGDLAYPDGSEANFRDCFGPTWGRYKERMRPAPGNHEFHASGASPYFKYFGAAAGDPERGYYSFDLGHWHIIALNSECAKVEGCDKGSPQELWLKEDLKQHGSQCILAYWHVPLFSSGAEHGNAPTMKAFWDDLYAAGADIVLNGHDHDYERFALQDPGGTADPDRGIREFVVGTGGKNLRAFNAPLATTEKRSNEAFGVLQLTLKTRAMTGSLSQ